MAKKIDRSKRKFKSDSEKSTPSVFEIIDNIENDHPVTRKIHLDMIYRYAMYLGYQYFTPNYDDNELVEEIRKRDARCTYNYTAGFCDTFDAKMLKDRPIPQFYPIGFDPNDIQAARFENIALESWWKKKDISALWFEAIGWASRVGTGFIKEYYDGESGKIISGDQIKFREGEIAAEVFPPWNGFPDPRATRMENARWFIHMYPMPLSTLGRLYPEKDGKVAAETVEDYRSVLASYTEGQTADETDDVKSLDEECVMVREYWERSIEGHDAGKGKGKGRFIVRANHVTLHDGPNPFDERLPFMAVTVKKPADSFWGMGLIAGIADMQHDLNRVNSLTMENIDWTAMVKIIAPKGCNIEDNVINKFSGEVIEVDSESGIEPHQMAIQGMPGYVAQFKQEILSAMMDVVGLHEVSFSQLPPRSSQMSGRALNQLVEAESARFSREIMDIAKVMKEMAIFYLELAQKKYTAKRKEGIIGQYRGTEVESFNGADLRGQTDAFVEVGSGFGLSPSARNDNLIMLFDRKVIDGQKLLQLSEFGTSGKLFYEATLDENKANRHILSIIEKGVAPNISAYDNHQAIIKVFKDFVRRPEYDKLDLKIQTVIEAYMDGHAMKELELAVRMQKMQQAAQAQIAPPQQVPQPTTGAPVGQPAPQAMTPEQTMQGMEEAMAQSPGAPSQDMGGQPLPQE